MKASKEKQYTEEDQAMGCMFMGLDAILNQLDSMRDNAVDNLDPDDSQSVWQLDIDAIDAVKGILLALKEEDITDPEAVKDLIYDYRGLVKQYRAMHQKYEMAVAPERAGKAAFCSACHKPLSPGENFCWNCSQRIGWGRKKKAQS